MTVQPSPGAVKLTRHFLPKSFTVTTPESIYVYFKRLLDAEIGTEEDAFQWLNDRSELAFVLEEELAWRYIRMNCDTANKVFAEAFHAYVTEIEPQVSRWSDQLDEKWLSLSFSTYPKTAEEKILSRQIRNRHELFREENVDLQAEIQVLEQIYGKVASEMTVDINNKEFTLQQAANFLRSNDRKERKMVFQKITRRRLQDTETLQQNFSELIKKRTQIARNAGYDNYRDYRFRELGRFDYTANDCTAFQDAIAAIVVPVVDRLNEERKEAMGLDTLRPYDIDPDPFDRPPLQPFTEIPSFISKAITGFQRIDPLFGVLLDHMNQNGYLDLESRKGKAPGGFNYPLYESNIPFIFMNATGNLRDLETLFHEGGHAIHSFLSSHLAWIENKEIPSEVAELASMSMELISMDQWSLWFPDKADLNRAKREQLEGIIRILPWIAAIDRFQHRIYTEPDHTPESRNRIWMECLEDFGSQVVSWEGFEDYKARSWQKQLHLFQFPFYYIEYGIAQMGALGIWRNYKKNHAKALKAYKNALALGYGRTIPEIYQAADIRFDFSREYIAELMDVVYAELASTDQ